MGVLARLYLRWLWLARSYSFRWAHKPLCRRFREDVLRFGHIYLCRSCFCLYLGLGAGLLAPTSAGGADVPGGWAPAALGAALAVLSSPSLYKKLPRPVRDLLRFALGMAISLWFRLLLLGQLLLCLPLLLCGLVLWLVYQRERAARKKRACLACPEYTGSGICSGFSRQAELVRRYEEEATDFFLRSGCLPDCLSGKELGRDETR